MKKLLLILMLFVVSNSAMAEWSVIWKKDDSTTYINRETIVLNGGILKVWTVVDETTPHTLPGGIVFLSMVVRMAYNCKEREFKLMDAFAYDGNMGGGKQVLAPDLSNRKWQSVRPRGRNAVIFKEFCTEAK
jgi:hypothetical protein